MGLSACQLLQELDLDDCMIEAADSAYDVDVRKGHRLRITSAISALISLSQLCMSIASDLIAPDQHLDMGWLYTLTSVQSLALTTAATAVLGQGFEALTRLSTLNLDSDGEDGTSSYVQLSFDWCAFQAFDSFGIFGKFECDLRLHMLSLERVSGASKWEGMLWISCRVLHLQFSCIV